MRRHRQILAIALVATALCADRAVTAAPILRPQSASSARSFVSRLSAGLRRAIPSTAVYESRRDGVALAEKSFSIPQNTACFRTRLSLLILHLPPPLV
jgi:hypothetical protein